MTTIAYRDGILAADTRLLVDDNRKSTCTKIRYLPNGIIIACSGEGNNEARALRFFSRKDWELDDEPPRIKKQEFQCIMIINNKPFACEGALHPHPIENSYYTIGSGAPFAASAMEMGMSAEEAVKFASKLDINTNDIVTTYKIPNAKEKSAAKKPKATQ